MKIFQKDNQIKSLSRIVIIKDGMQTINPTEEMVIADGWIEFKAPEPTAEELLVRAKKDKIREIEDYDSSYNVNEFYVQGASIWLDKATRAGLKLRFEAEKESCKTDTALWYNGIQYPLTVKSAIDMLLKVELYASECYDNTQRHIAAVSALETVDDLAAYNYTVGYPEKLNF